MNPIITTGSAALWAGIVLPLAAWCAWSQVRLRRTGWIIASAGAALWFVGVGILSPLGAAATIAIATVAPTIVVISYPATQHLRVPFKVWVATVWMSIFVIAGTVFMLAGFDNDWMRDKAPFIAGGLYVTVIIAVASIILATILALLGALGRLSRNPIAFGVAGFYTSFFRGTPLIVQMFLIYLALPQMAQGLGLPKDIEDLFLLDAAVAGILALGLNYGAYMTEIFRSGIQAVSHGQREAAEALGMTYRQMMRRIVLPQAFRIVIPPTGNEFIAMIKDTALVSFLGTAVSFMEIFRRSNLMGSKYYTFLEAYIVVAGMYWVLTMVFTFFQARLEQRLSRGYVRAAAKVANEGGIVVGEPGGMVH